MARTVSTPRMGEWRPSQPARTPQTGRLIYIGVSGDGDSLSIGLGHLCHAIRRNVKMAYVIENNGVYGLTKGQFSASADVGSKSKRGEDNRMSPIDPVMLGLSLGATFLARSFSGDKEQLVPILKAALAHRGFALVDVISPCVTFNDHGGSTKSYLYTRKHAVRRNRDRFRASRRRDRRRDRRRTEHRCHDARRQRGPVPVRPEKLRSDRSRGGRWHVYRSTRVEGRSSPGSCM